jgi:hypothetical protein
MYPMKQQRMNLWCWAAVAQSVHKFFTGDELEQCDIARHMTGLTGFNCCNPPAWDCDVAWELDEPLQYVGHYRGAFQGIVDFNYVRQSIQAGFPICARIGWRMGNGGHFVVICGYTISDTGEPWLTIADPKRGISRWPYDVFSNAYRGLGEWTDTYLLQQ